MVHFAHLRLGLALGLGRLESLQLILQVHDPLDIASILGEGSVDCLVLILDSVLSGLELLLELVPDLRAFWIFQGDLFIFWELEAHTIKNIPDNQMLGAN